MGRQRTRPGAVPSRLGEVRSVSVDDVDGRGVINAVPPGPVANDAPYWLMIRGWCQSPDKINIPYFSCNRLFVRSKSPCRTLIRYQASVQRVSHGPGTDRRGESKGFTARKRSKVNRAPRIKTSENMTTTVYDPNGYVSDNIEEQGAGRMGWGHRMVLCPLLTRSIYTAPLQVIRTGQRIANGSCQHTRMIINGGPYTWSHAKFRADYLDW